MLTASIPRPERARFHHNLAKHDGRAPRYTSYPPATEFTPKVDADLYRAWLGALDPAEAVSLYIHVPFCKRLCWYCGCNTKVVNNPALVSRYAQDLREEMALLEDALPARLPVGFIHFGGGTPNLLARDDLTLLFEAIRHVFRVKPGAEISVEADPSVMTAAWARAAAHHGVTRASLGVQDLAPAVQAAVNRWETFDQLKAAVDALRGAGIGAINFDLMYGLPRQSTAGLLHTIDRALTLSPDRIALFGYAHVPWAAPHQRLIDEKELPNPDQRMDLVEAVTERLSASGYVRIGMDHFARQDDPLAAAAHSRLLRRNFQGYTTDPCRTLIGLGASSIGRLPQGYVQNASSELAWRTALEEGRLPVQRGVALSAEDRFRGDIIESLLCHFGVDLAAVCARHDRPLEALGEERHALAGFVEDGMLTRKGETYHITEDGRPFVRAICAVFDAYRTPGMRNSRIV